MYFLDAAIGPTGCLSTHLGTFAIVIAVLAALAVFMIVTYTKRKNKSKDNAGD